MTALSSPSSLPPVILLSAPNGARRTKADHPAIPITPAELARCAAEIRAAGASLMHVHVRDGNGEHVLNADAYRQAITAIRQEVGDELVLQITTEAVGRYQPAEQIAVVQAVRPEAVSVALRELIPNRTHESAAAQLFADLYHQRSLIQPILYAPAEVIWLGDLMRRGILPDELVCPLFVLGRYSEGQRSNPADLARFVERWLAIQEHKSHVLPWSMCAFGPEETSCAMAALSMGGHPRVGFENSLWSPNGALLSSHAETLQRLVNGAEIINRPVASAAQARAILAGNF